MTENYNNKIKKNCIPTVYTFINTFVAPHIFGQIFNSRAHKILMRAIIERHYLLIYTHCSKMNHFLTELMINMQTMFIGVDILSLWSNQIDLY